MKRMLSVLLCLCMVFSLWGCTEEPVSDPTESPTKETADPTQPTTNMTGDATVPVDATELTAVDAGTVTSLQSGQYQESKLLTNIPGQKTALLLSVRSDGTLDYIFCDRTENECRYEPVTSLKDGGYRYYTVAPDGSCVKQDEQWIGQLDAMLAESRSEAQKLNAGWYIRFYGGEGNILVECILSSDTMHRRVLYHLKDGKLSQIPLQGENFDTYTPTDHGFYAVAVGQALQLYAYDGTLRQTCGDIDPALMVFLDIRKDTGWFSNGQRDQISAIGLPDGDGLLLHPRQEGTIICASATPDGTGLYIVGKSYDEAKIRLEYCDTEGIRRLNDDTAGYAFENPGATPVMIAAANDGRFYTWAKGVNRGVLRRYDYNPQGEKESDGLLTVYSLKDNQTVRTAVALWNQTHPDIMCEYIVASDEAGNSALTMEDLITQLNTQLVNGEGPDVLILDGLPADSLMDKGFLMPLTGLDVTGVYPNLLERFTMDGMLYAVPGKMTPYLLGRATKTTEPVNSLESFADLVETKTGKLNCAFWGGTQKVNSAGDSGDAIYYVQFADEVFDLWYPAWSDAIWSDNRFDEELYREFLTQTGRLVEHYSLETIDQLLPVFGEIPKAGLSKTEYTVINATDSRYAADGSYPYCLAATSYVGLSNFFALEDVHGAVSCEIVGIPGPDGTGAATVTAIGALRAGGDTEAGLEFLGLLLSDEVQTTVPYYGIHSSDGYPVKWSCTPALLELTAEFYGEKPEITNDFETALGELRGVIMDEFLYDKAKEAALRYYEGNLTLEEAIAQVKSSVSIYLAERVR